MGTCGDCNREMMDKEPCLTDKQIEFADGSVYDALPVGTRWTDGHCPDCWAPPEEMHHSGCDWEQCPKCNGQLLSCDCRTINHF